MPPNRKKTRPAAPPGERWYGILKGRECGVFQGWKTTHRRIDRYSGAVFEGFASRAEAAAYVRRGLSPSPEPRSQQSIIMDSVQSIVDSVQVGAPSSQNSSPRAETINGGSQVARVVLKVKGVAHGYDIGNTVLITRTNGDFNFTSYTVGTNSQTLNEQAEDAEDPF
ncbi:hypothetical protein ACJ41O_009021 [Fusarium nematophilum]